VTVELSLASWCRGVVVDRAWVATPGLVLALRPPEVTDCSADWASFLSAYEMPACEDRHYEEPLSKYSLQYPLE